MKRFLPTHIVFTAIFVLLLYRLILSPASAVTSTKAIGQSTNVSAKVGEFSLNISGYIAPFATVTLTTTDGTFLRSVVANAQGYFTITAVQMKSGFAGFCLTAIDYKNLGDSQTCITIPPATDDVTMDDLFLPPTLGLFRSEVNEGGKALAFGYSMPGARVTLKVGAITFTAIADSTGYYEIYIENLSSGSYTIYAEASLNGKDSLKPKNGKPLTVLTLAEQAFNWVEFLFQKLLALLSSLWLILLIIPLLALILFLLWKLFPTLLRRRKRLHHWWFVGY